MGKVLLMSVGMVAPVNEASYPTVNVGVVDQVIRDNTLMLDTKAATSFACKTMVCALFACGHDKVVLVDDFSTVEARDRWKSEAWNRFFMEDPSKDNGITIEEFSAGELKYWDPDKYWYPDNVAEFQSDVFMGVDVGDPKGDQSVQIPFGRSSSECSSCGGSGISGAQGGICSCVPKEGRGQFS